MRVILKLLTPPVVLDTGRNKNSAHSKVKKEDWTGRKREKIGQLCPSTETGAVQAWAVVNRQCQLHSFNQSINDCIVTWSNGPTKKRHWIGSYQWQISSIDLPKIEDWISLSSGYHSVILKDTLYRKQVGRVWKWSFWSASVHSHSLRFLLKVDFFPVLRCWFKRHEEGFDPHREHLEIIASQIFRFRSGRGVSVISEWPTYYFLVSSRVSNGSHVGVFHAGWVLK